MKVALIATVGLRIALLPTDVQAVEVPSRVVQNAALASSPSQGVYDARLEQSSEASEVSVQMPVLRDRHADFWPRPQHGGDALRAARRLRRRCCWNL